MELKGIVVIKEDEEAESSFDDGEWMFSCEGRHHVIVEDKDRYGSAAVDLVVELCLGKVAVEGGIFRRFGENLCDVMAGDGVNDGEER